MSHSILTFVPNRFQAGTKFTEMTLPEEKVLAKLNAVPTAKKLANMVSPYS